MRRERCRLEAQTEPQSYQPFIDAVASAVRGRRNRREAAEIPDRTVRVQLQVRDIAVGGLRNIEERRVRQIERLQPDLEIPAIVQLELTIDAQIERIKRGSARRQEMDSHERSYYNPRAQ